MPDENANVLYDGLPIWANLVTALLWGIGGLVFVPIGLINRAWWLLVLATPLLLAGLLLRQIRLCIAVERPTGIVCVTHYLVGLKMHQRRYLPSDVLGLDLQRVAGDEGRERPSDTWYLKLRFLTRTHTIGKYDSRVHALEARLRLGRVLQAGPQMPTAGEMRTAAVEKVQGQPESADGHYQMGLALLRSGDRDGARQAFQTARNLAREPLLRRMIEQRLEELAERESPPD